VLQLPAESGDPVADQRPVTKLQEHTSSTMEPDHAQHAATGPKAGSMAAEAGGAEASPDGLEPPRSIRARIGHTLSGWRQLGRIAYRDPEHVAQRLTLYSAQNLGEPSLEWAHAIREARPEVPRAVIAEELRTQTAQVARIDGAVSGTPFLIALIPGYLSYLREEGRMVLRTAALYGRDPRELETSAEVLTLRGVHPTVDAAREALENVRAVPLPEKPVKRRSVRTWVHSITVLLIFGGFLSAPSDERDESAHPWLKAALGFGIRAAIVVPAPPPHPEPARRMPHREIRIEHDPVHAVIAAGEQIAAPLAEHVGHPRTVGQPRPATRLPRRGHRFRAKSRNRSSSACWLRSLRLSHLFRLR
jgi:hypothetical protein